MEANPGDIITFTYYSNGGDINVDPNIYSGQNFEGIVIFKDNSYNLFVCMPTRSGLAVMHKVDRSHITKVTTPYNKFIEAL